ncbi:hypothetical protein CIK05_11640 [Bdellovibrio sp. qaytius]|nr:hypothetical protein CIK05_11640 [Bdellovibrio sp. qaytius]
MINSQLLLFLNLGFGLLLVLYFVLGRPKPKQPTRLNMRAKSSEEKKPIVLEPEAQVKTGYNPRIVDQSEPPPVSRSLSVMFMYNGHDWEAHDVLGVPQGASMHEVTKVYQHIVKTTDSRSLHFYEHAYAAISARHRKQKL